MGHGQVSDGWTDVGVSEAKGLLRMIAPRGCDREGYDVFDEKSS